MNSTDTTKKKISKTVADYRQYFPSEYKQFKAQMEAMRAEKRTDGTLKGEHIMEHHLVEFPETLFYALRRRLSDDEWAWLFANGKYKKDFRGINWFIKQFTEFSVVEI